MFSPERSTINQKTTTMNITENTITVDEIVQPRFSTPLEATHASSTRSHRYGFISTQEIIQNFAENGYEPRQIQLARTRKEENQGFQKHLIRFAHRDLASVGGVASPEFVLLNSHDGTSSARLALGLQVTACLNGVIAGDIIQQVKIYHRAADVSRFIEAATHLRNNVPLLSERVAAFRERQLTPSETQGYLTDALNLRYPKPDSDAPVEDRLQWENQLYYLNRARRYADSGTNLWETFNRVQENLIKGRRGTGIRRVTAPTTDFKLNKDLWNLTEQYLLN